MVRIDEAFQKAVKEETERRLASLGISPDLLTKEARTEISTLTTATSAVKAIAEEKVNIKETVVLKLSTEEKTKK